MAQIASGSETKIFQISKWLGLNESPDGDTHLKMGEAAAMRNFRITRENHLQLRPGCGVLAELSEGDPVQGMWSGYVGGTFHVVAACGGRLWDIDLEGRSAEDKGALEDGRTFFFGFANQLYILTGTEYYAWDGAGAPQAVEGYIPIVTTAVPPAGGGTLLEGINLLTGKKRAEYSPDGTATVFQLPEREINEIVAVEGTEISYTTDLTAGTLTFASAPGKGINTVTITWRKGTGQREKVTGMRFAELYNGASDSRVFLYGDGTNEAVYSGLDENGKASAAYFPELNVIAVDSANTPITGMIRHYDQLLIFKPDSAYACQYSTLSLANDGVTAAFYTSSLNRAIGNEAPGQVRLVGNDPRTLFGRSVYEWGLAVYGTRDERNAKRMSDRVTATLGRFELKECICFDDEWSQEYYIFHDGEALVNNYANDTWYYYDNLPVTAVVGVKGALYFGTPEGEIMEFSRRYRNDNLQEIDASWESGAMDFDRDWRRKHSASIWISVKPESQSRVTVTAQSNRKSEHVKKIVASSLASFANVSFAHWSFQTNRKPQVQRVRLKVKKFTFYKLIFSSRSASATTTILAADFQIRYTGNVK